MKRKFYKSRESIIYSTYESFIESKSSKPYPNGVLPRSIHHRGHVTSKQQTFGGSYFNNGASWWENAKFSQDIITTSFFKKFSLHQYREIIVRRKSNSYRTGIDVFVVEEYIVQLTVFRKVDDNLEIKQLACQLLLKDIVLFEEFSSVYNFRIVNFIFI